MIAARHSSGHGPFQTRWMPLRSSLKNASFLVRLTAGNATEDLLFVHTDCPCCLGSFQSLPNRNATDDCLRWISLVNNRTRKTRDGIDLVVGVVRRSKHNNETKEEPDAEAEARTCDDVSYGATYVPHEIIYLCYPSYLIESRKSSHHGLFRFRTSDHISSTPTCSALYSYFSLLFGTEGNGSNKNGIYSTYTYSSDSSWKGKRRQQGCSL